MKQNKIEIKWIFLLCAGFFLAVASSCAPVQTKSTGGQPTTTSVSPGGEEIRRIVNREHLQAALMDFADTFASKYTSATFILMEQEPGPERVYASRTKFFSLMSAFDIASGRHPEIGVVNMVVLVTLTRITWEEYWQPNVYGNSAQMLIETLRQLEEDIWRLAARILTPEQSKRLRALIYEWREKNPNRRNVTFVRLNGILDELGKYSVFQEEMQPGGLFAPVREATQAVDEIRFFSERAMYLLSRMQAALSLQIEMVYHDLATEGEVSQLLSDITGFRETVERLPAHISAERENLMRDLESQERTIRNVVGDIREMVRESKDLIALVNDTTKTVDTTSARIDGLLTRPSSGRPFDIMDYYNTVLAASDTVQQANLLLDSAGEVMASANWEQGTPVVLKKITDDVAAEGKGVITHAAIMGAALILFFCLTFFPALLGYRYVSKRIAR